MPDRRNCLCGAGANAKTLSVAEEKPAAIKSMIEKISCPAYKLPETDYMPDSDRSWESFRQEVIVDLQWLYDKSKNHAGAETFVRNFYSQQQKEEITKLRSIRSMFQTMIQLEESYDEK